MSRSQTSWIDSWIEMDRYEKLETHMDPDRVRIELTDTTSWIEIDLSWIDTNFLDRNRYQTSWTRSRSRSKKFFMSIQLNSISIQEAFHVDLDSSSKFSYRSSSIQEDFHVDPAQVGLDRSSSSRSGSIQLKSMWVDTKNSRTQHDNIKLLGSRST